MLVPHARCHKLNFVFDFHNFHITLQITNYSVWLLTKRATRPKWPVLRLWIIRLVSGKPIVGTIDRTLGV